MNRAVWLCASLFALFACNHNAKPGVNVDTQKKEIAQILKQQQQAWNNGDIEGFMQGYLKDTSRRFIGAKGGRSGWNKTFLAYKKGYPDKESMGVLEFKIDSICMLDEAATIGNVLGKWKLYRKSDTPLGHFSLITKKTDSGQKIIMDHTW